MKSPVALACALAALLVAVASVSARAADDPGSEAQCHHRQRRWAVSISPRYYGLNTSGYSSAFTSNGLSGPKSGTVGADLSVYWQTAADWQVGFGLGSVSYENDNGSNVGSYSQGFLGLWVARDFALTRGIDVSVGGLFGYGFARTEVLSTFSNGRTTEDSFILEPKVIAAYRIAPWMKIGISGAYIEPLAQTDSIRGETVTSGNISLHGLSGGVEFIFGHFGATAGENKPAVM